MKRLVLILLLVPALAVAQTTKLRLGTQTQGIVPSAQGGTGINNGTNTLTLTTNSGTIAFPSASTVQTFPTTTQTIAGLSETQTFTNKRITKRQLATVAPGAAPTFSTDNYDQIHFTGLNANITSVTPTGTPVAGDTLLIDLTDDGTARTIAWGGNFESSPGETLPSSTVANTRLDIIFSWNQATSKWRCIGSSDISNAGASDIAYGVTWNGITTVAPSKNAVYDELHLFDSNDDGVLGPGIPIDSPTITGGTFLQPSNVSTASVIYGRRFTNTTPAGHLMLFNNANDSVTLWEVDAATGTLNNGVIPLARIDSRTANTLIGRGNGGGAGTPQEITLGNGLSMSTTVLGIAAPLDLTISDAATTTIPTTLTLGHNTSGAPAAGFGSALVFRAQDSTTPDSAAGRISTTWTTATHGSNVADMAFSATTGGVNNYVNSMTLHGNGILDVSAGYRINGASATSGKILQSDGVKYNDSAYTFPSTIGTNTFVLTSNGTNAVWSAASGGGGSIVRTVRATWQDLSGAVLTTPQAAKGVTTVPYSGTITGWVISTSTGTATVKWWKKANAGAIPTSADNINTSGITNTGTHLRSSTVTDFGANTTVTAGDMFIGNLTAITGSPSWVSAELEITSP